MSSRISVSQFEALKRQAKRLKRSSQSLTHSRALDQIAKDNGFANWSLLAREVVPPRDPGAALPYTVELSAWIRTDRGMPGRVIHEDIPSKHPAQHYSGLRARPNWQHFVGKEERDVRPLMEKVRRGIAFMDATDLRPSKAWTRVFGRGARLNGFDHTFVWMDSQTRYLVTTEPYIGSGKAGDVLNWASIHGWQSEILPRGKGIWLPCIAECAPTCAGHTQMIVLSPPKRAGDLSGVVRALRDGAKMGPR